MLPEPNQIVLTEDVKKSGQVKVLFLGNVFSRLNALNGAKKGWAKLRCCTLFNGVSQHACSHPEESLESADSTP